MKLENADAEGTAPLEGGCPEEAGGAVGGGGGFAAAAAAAFAPIPSPKAKAEPFFEESLDPGENDVLVAVKTAGGGTDDEVLTGGTGGWDISKGLSNRPDFFFFSDPLEFSEGPSGEIISARGSMSSIFS